MTRLLSWILPCLLVAAGSAHAEGIALVGLRTVGVDDSTQRALLQAAEAAVAEAGDEQGLVVQASMQKDTCGLDRACVCAAGRAASTGIAVSTRAGRAGNRWTLDALVLLTQDCSIMGEQTVTGRFTTEAAAERLQSLVSQALIPPGTRQQTASKARRDIGAVPGIIAVFTRREIEELGLRTLQDVLRLVPGFEVVDHNAFDTPLHLGMPATVLFALNGVPLVRANTNVRFLPRDFQIRLEAVERIEVVRGPAGTVWGPNALLGVVNIITREAGTTGVDAEARIGAGSLETGMVSGALSAGRDDIGVSAAGQLFTTRGPMGLVEDSPFAIVGVPEPVFGNGGTTKNGRDFYGDVHLVASLFDRLQLRFSHISHVDRTEISSNNGALMPGGVGLWDKWNRVFSAIYTQPLGSGFELRASAAHDEFLNWEIFPIHPRSPADPGGQVSTQGHATDPQIANLVDLQLSHHVALPAFENTITIGAMTLHQVQPDSLATRGPIGQELPPVLSFPGRTLFSAGAFAHNDMLLFDWLGIWGGLRYENRNILPRDDLPGATTHVLQGQVALLMRGRWGYIKALYSEGFRPPSAVNLFSTVGTKGDPTLVPERSRGLSTDLQGRLRLGPALVIGNTSGGLTAIDDLILNTPVENPEEGFTSIPKNLGRILIWDASASCHVDLSWFSVGGAYSFKHLQESDPVGEGIPYAAHTGSGTVVVRPVRDASIGATLAVSGARRMSVRGPEGVRVEVLPAALWPTLTATYKNLFDAVDVSVIVQNPLGVTRQTTTLLDGGPAVLEKRSASEVMVVLRGHLQAGEDVATSLLPPSTSPEVPATVAPKEEPKAPAKTPTPALPDEEVAPVPGANAPAETPPTAG